MESSVTMVRDSSTSPHNRTNQTTESDPGLCIAARVNPPLNRSALELTVAPLYQSKTSVYDDDLRSESAKKAIEMQGIKRRLRIPRLGGVLLKIRSSLTRDRTVHPELPRASLLSAHGLHATTPSPAVNVPIIRDADGVDEGNVRSLEENGIVMRHRGCLTKDVAEDVSACNIIFRYLLHTDCRHFEIYRLVWPKTP